MSKWHKGFPPIVDGYVEVLILGSFPSLVSLSKAQYYGHPQNQFWRLMGAVLGAVLADMDYEERKRTLLAHHIGLWDIIASCTRNGSLDSNIRAAGANDYAAVLDVASRLRRICFNGKTAARAQPQFAQMGFDTLILPSSSPAYTLAFDKKLVAWRKIPLPSRNARRGCGVSTNPRYAVAHLTPDP
jgi:TDG/mug DNA glycosylase family protein